MIANFSVIDLSEGGKGHCGFCHRRHAVMILFFFFFKDRTSSLHFFIL